MSAYTPEKVIKAPDKSTKDPPASAKDPLSGRVELSAPPWVIGTIKYGLILPLRTKPTPYSRPNQLSAQIIPSRWMVQSLS